MNIESKMKISKSGLQSGSPLELFKLAWLVIPEKLKIAFSDNVEIQNEDDLIALAEIANQQLNGKLQTPESFDIMSILKKQLEFTSQERERAKSLNYIA